MQILNKSNELEDYLSAIYIMSHSYSTVSSYRLSIVNKNKSGFRDFLQQKYNIDEFELVYRIKKKELDVYVILKEFVIFLDKLDYKPNSIQQRLAAAKGYLRHLGLKIYSEDCKLIRLPKKIRQREEPLTKEMILRVLRSIPQKLQTIILVLTSSGMRIGELVQLRLADVDFTTTPTIIRIRAQTTKTRESRETFLTSEATSSFKDYLKRFFGWKEDEDNSHLKDTIIFGRTSQIKNQNKKSQSKIPPHLTAEVLLMGTLSYHLDKVPGLDVKNPSGRRVIHFHAFRKFFRTTVGNVCGRDYAEALMGHGFYMDTYYNLPNDKRREMYMDTEPYLTISDFKAVEKNLKSLSTEYSQLKKDFEDLKQYLRTSSIHVPKSMT